MEAARQVSESLICQLLEFFFPFVDKWGKMEMLILWEGCDHRTRNLQTSLGCCEVMMSPQSKGRVTARDPLGSKAVGVPRSKPVGVPLGFSHPHHVNSQPAFLSTAF